MQIEFSAQITAIARSLWKNRVRSLASMADRQRPLELQLFRTHYAALTRPNELQDDNFGYEGWSLSLSYMARMVAFVALVGLILYIMHLIMKFMGRYDEEDGAEQVTATETNQLLSKSGIAFTYGTCDEEDVESGKSCVSSSDDLYDAKICIICYDGERNCFFVPCGHCIGCYICARRMIDGENKDCPVCRRFIHRVRKLFTSEKIGVRKVVRLERE